jgi:hypothetical protein
MTALRFGVFVLTMIVALLAGMQPTHAATLSVDTTADDPAATACTDAAPNDCSLRGAITKANSLSEASIIMVPAGTYVLSQAANCAFRSHQFGPFVVNSTALCIGADMTIIGAGASDTIIDGNLTGRAFMVSDQAVEIRGLTLRNGMVPSSTPGSFLGNLSGGGAINNGGSLTLVDCAILESTSAGDGGALYNGHSLTVLRTAITRNTAGGAGGGIANVSFLEVTTLAVLDSTISGNFTLTGTGGGIQNFGGVAIVSGSTISGNSTVSLGGGIYNINNSGVLAVTNSTISGNTSGSEGGGVFNSAVADFNGVTITDNFSANAGGGIYRNVGTLTVANTLIAGNRSQNNFSPDCFGGSLISQGHNLLRDASGCPLTGDTTGNIIGQDPRLGALADNGGPTPTHALGNGSPAIDAGSPAVPGSGGAACAALDQRGFLRPLGAACDIGAFERGGAFSIAKIQPSSGGNTGSSSALISGNGFLPGATVKLTRAGQPDIVGNPLQVDVGGSAIAATFDLTGRPTGPWDVVVLDPDSTSRTLPAGFTIEAGGAPDLWVDVIGLTRRHGPSTLTIIYGNRGKVDALAVPLSISLPQGYSAGQYFAITPPPEQPGEVRPDWNQIPPVVADQAQSGFLELPLLLPIVPSGFTGVLSFSLTLPANAPDSSLVAAIGDPAFKASVDPKFITDAATGAQAYLQQIFGIVIPASLVPPLQQYATTQLQQVTANGRAAFTASFGTQPQVYSLAQLQVDLAWFAALRVGSSP